MAWIDIETVFKNTTMQESVINGTKKGYKIKPVSGYVLHANNYDTENEEGNIILGFTKGYCTCSIDYDFELNSREFYAVPENTVDNIF